MGVKLGLTLMEEYRLRVFENRALRRIFGPKSEEVAGGWRRLHNEELHNLYASSNILLLLSLAPQPSLGLGLLHKIRLNFLEASQQFSFLQGRVVSPTPNPHPGGPGLCIYILQRKGGYPF
jgi:hypothetical protein